MPLRQYSRSSAVKDGETYTVEIECGSGLEQHFDEMLSRLGLELFNTDVLTNYKSRSVALFGVHSAAQGMPERRDV